MKSYEKALALINAEPLPDNAEEQLEALSDEAEGLELTMINGLAEALFERRNNQEL
ncbi:hypothetical protein PT300_13295 [Enterobacteriaceae bacterium ESL0689]|nr:hypothetical protein [Enterobacteriaceae bacterium ESL0689]